MTTNLVDENIGSKKLELLDYYRSRAIEFLNEVKQSYGESQYRERAAYINSSLIETRENLIKIIEQTSVKGKWEKNKIVGAILMLTYTNYVVMMESRNSVWPYEYMTFSRRIGELWEPFCQLCWDYPINEKISYFIPPLFRDVRNKLTLEIEVFIDNLNITDKQKTELKKYYQKVWTMVTSGEIKLELDLHFTDGKEKYIVDLKSGFSSNEKGNTNRLLLVASVYKILEEGHICDIYVRSSEDQNNHYLQILKRSGLWNVYCGEESYKQIEKHTGFNLLKWIRKNVNWEQDFSKEMYAHLNENNLIQYLEW